MNTTSAPTRLFFLDWLRIAAFGLLILYHVGMYYVSWDWHVKSPFASTDLEPWMRLSSPWRLSLLFLVSGAAVSMMLVRGASTAFARSRSRRLLLPLLCGMLVVVPPQAYFEVVHKHGFDGGYLDFMTLYLRGYGGFCDGSRCLILPTWNHLWFVAYLWVYCMLLWALLKWRPALLDTLAGQTGRRLSGPWLVVLPIVVLTLLRMLLAGRFPVTHALVDDWFNHAQYLAVFLLGAVWARQPAVWPRIEALRWTALAVALTGWAAMLAMSARFGMPSSAPGAAVFAWRAVYSATQWCAILAAIGFAYRHLNVGHRLHRYLVDAVFPVYILHQTLIVVLAQVLRPLGWAPALEGPLLVAATFVLSFAGYEAVRRVPMLRPWFGLSNAGRAVHAPAIALRAD
ncbi:acyltransferase family protein [Piscinibacter sp. XHJ-5]|uniref:acyltransferase family protein n=1 Tax=Piscinibacter sp. XHJ-5 TaxID=3037797 RepID=UPI002452CFE0|nr:acyltransferase family protein [Piscinibacter sp. XHJ-5]